MIIPFDCEDVFELNNDLHPQFDGEVIIIDNIFKNFQNILNLCYNTPVEKWKNSPNSRNFKDYYDCRLVFNNHFPNYEKLNNRLQSLLTIASDYFNPEGDLTSNSKFYFNYFKHKKLNVPDNFQHYPHKDLNYNCVFYIDPHNNGGTALYEDLNISHKEEDNIFYDISNLKMKQLIYSIPNRCAIFPGNVLHGGYIKNHNKYYYNWRINLVHFFSIGN